MDLVTVSAWKKFDWLHHGFSTRAGGVSTVYGGRSLNLGWTKDDEPALVAENRRRFVAAVTQRETVQRAVTLRQIHGTGIEIVRDDAERFETAQGRALLAGDGLITDQPGALLGIQTADCVPVIIIDPEKHAVGIFHAGWRGTVAGIVEAGVAKLAAEYNSRPEDLLAAVGPSIGACCYLVGEEVRTSFQERFRYADELFRDDHLNLWESNQHQLIDAGLQTENVMIVGECTGCALDAMGNRKYFSHRIDRGVAGRMMTLVSVDG